MKTWRAIFGLVFTTAFLLGTNLTSSAQTNTFRRASFEYGIIPIFTNNPVAMYVITNLLQEPMPELAVPAVSQMSSTPGTYWTLKGAPVPLPFNPYPELDVYQVTTNGQFIIDDRSVDYVTLNELAALEAEAFATTNTTVFTNCQICEWNDHGLLWIEASNSLATPDYFTVALHNTVQGQSYDVMTTPNLMTSPATELVVTGAVGTVTPVQIPMNNRTNLFVKARTSVAYSFYLVSLPLSQDVLAGDTVTFYVETGGNTNLTFQWTLNGNAIAGATNSSYTIYNVQSTDAGDYACLISDGTNSLLTAAGTLTVENGTGDLNIMAVASARQNYTFKSGVTYYIGSQIQFYGNTTIEAGAVIKPDWYYNAGLVIMGNLTCKGEPYYPAVITSVDDDSFGAGLGFSQDDGPPQPYITGVPYLELACCKSNSISNLRIAYADYGVTTPTDSRRLDVWDCQFLQCNYGVVNLVTGYSTNTLHNVLFAACSAAIGAATNAITIEAEQVTADVGDFCLASVTPSRMALTNCIIWGNSPSASSMASVHVSLNPDETNFVSSGAGIYYLAANSPLHQSGSAGISPRLQVALKNKTTFAPVAIAPFTQISGQITLAPQAQRYTNGAPDVGYHYDALDYTVADLRLTGGTLTVLPGTAIGFRIEFVEASQQWTFIGMDVRENSSIVSQGMPNKPCVFVDVQQVQEQFQWPVWSGFVPDYFPTYLSDSPPVLNFRFANFYAGYVSYYTLPQYHFWSGMSLYGFEWSPDSAMNFTLHDCKVRGGQIDIGNPDNPDNGQGLLNYDTVLGSGAVTWNNNLFDGVSINLNPTYYWYNQITNCDLQVTANNNLFRNSAWLIISGIPATAGNWTFRDNLFDKVQFYQNPTLPLDFDHNGYWPLTGAEIIFGANGYTNQLQATATSSGATEVFLTNVPQYRGGVFGNYYLSQTTPLYQAGSRTADDAGLTQYTTFVNQSKDASGQPVNIGLHYVAATNSLALDSDSDGVPDYVEVEHGTEINNAMTDGVTNDTYNVAYDDVDLSGNGLAGRIKKALELNPTNALNPLILKQVITGDEPETITFEMPVNYDALTNIGSVNLEMNGVAATMSGFERATNGNTRIYFATTFDPAGQYCLQARLAIDTGAWQEGAITLGDGAALPFYSTNILQFFENNSMFDDTSAYLDAKLSVPEADYQIELYDPSTTPHTLLATITNSTTDGTIQEEWDLSTLGYTGGEVEADYTVTPTGNSASVANAFANKASRILTRATNSLSEWGPNFDVMYMFTPENSSFNSYFSRGGSFWTGMQGMVDALIAPRWPWSVYQSYFNRYLPDSRGEYPGYVSSMTAVTNNFLPDLANGATKNLFTYTHGSPGALQNRDGDVRIYAADVQRVLGNYFDSKAKRFVTPNPYRFVFLDGCETGLDPLWRRTFGIYPLGVSSRGKVGPQAFVGWAKERTPYANTEDRLTGYAATLQAFYVFWMSGQPLANCIKLTSDKSAYGCPLPVPENEIVTQNGVRTHQLVSPVYVIGHSGLKVDGLNQNFDNLYAPPKK